MALGVGSASLVPVVPPLVLPPVTSGEASTPALPLPSEVVVHSRAVAAVRPPVPRVPHEG